MIIEYDRSPNATMEQKFNSLVASIMRAFEDVGVSVGITAGYSSGEGLAYYPKSGGEIEGDAFVNGDLSVSGEVYIDDAELLALWESIT
ncbi:MAG: hypothetical protein Q4B18_02625 [Bacillota bacterium]|nr:hypothetical protein [Bacillota bacterium]